MILLFGHQMAIMPGEDSRVGTLLQKLKFCWFYFANFAENGVRPKSVSNKNVIFIFQGGERPLTKTKENLHGLKFKD